jgi:hypothetical protein
MLPHQGWKLHVTSPVPNAVDLVLRVLPVLREYDLCFKLPASLDGIIRMNSTQAGLTQVGKILTVYPASDVLLKDIVDRLRVVWRPPDPPAIRTDLAVSYSPALWLRYGAFLGESVLDALGRPQPVLRSPSGELVPDVRSRFGAQVDWAPAPPVKVSTQAASQHVTSPFFVDGHRFFPLRTLSDNARGRLFLAMRHPDCKLAVIRVAVPGVEHDAIGSDAPARLRNEYRVLSRLNGSEIGPAVLAFDSASRVLALEDLGGSIYVKQDARTQLGQLPEVARLVGRLHARGIVHRDLKLLNVMNTPKGIRLIDFELAAEIGTTKPVCAGTNGYVPPEGRYATVRASYDVYGLGVCLSHIGLGFCPGNLPARNSAGRQVGLLLLRGRHTAARTVADALHSDERRRPTAEQLATLLETRMPAMLTEALNGRSSVRPTINLLWVRTAAISAGFAARSFQIKQPVGHYWRNSHWMADYACEGINVGASGIILGLASIDAALRRSDFDVDICGAAEWLAARPGTIQAHGFFTGNAGVAVALAVAGRRLRRTDFVEAAKRRFELAASQQSVGYELFSGSAGILMAASLLNSIVQEPWPLERVYAHAERIQAAAGLVNGVVAWPTDKLFDSDGTPYFGAAHGTAGVAMALAMWGRLVGADKAFNLAAEAFASIHDSGLTSNRANILATATGVVRAPEVWCHGIAGYLWCMLQAFDDHDDLAEARINAIHAFADAEPGWSNPTMCHGTAGVLDTWRMLTRLASAEMARLAFRRTAEAVAALRTLQQRRDGRSMWSSEDPNEYTPDLWVGFLGPAASLALYTANQVHSILSPEWLGACAEPSDRSLSAERLRAAPGWSERPITASRSLPTVPSGPSR